MKNQKDANLVPFSLELAQELHNSEEMYPVDFDVAWEWLGYSTKSNAKKKLTSYFVENVDYNTDASERFIRVDESASVGGSSPEKIFLTSNCLKEMGMVAKTEKGRQVRKYFLECEEIAKKAIALIPQLQAKIVELEQRLQQKQLPPADIRITAFAGAIHTIDSILGINPYTAQQFKDLIGNVASEGNKNMSNASTEDWRGVVALAEDMGFTATIKGSHSRGLLGSWIRGFAPSLSDQKEKRLCNETQRPIWVYPLHDQEVKQALEAQIQSFFEHPAPSKALSMIGFWNKKV